MFVGWRLGLITPLVARFQVSSGFVQVAPHLGALMIILLLILISYMWGKLKDDLKGSQIASSIDSSRFVLKAGFDFYHNQLFEIENYNQPNTTNDYQKNLVVPFSSSQVVNVKAFKLNDKFQENGTLLFQSKIMISSHHLDLTFLHDSFHDNMILYSH